ARRRVVGRVDDDGAGLRRDGAAHLLPVDAVVGIAQLDVDGDAAVHLDSRDVAVVSWLENDHLIAGPYQGRERREDAIGRAWHYRDLVLGIVSCPVEGFSLFRDALAQA